MRKSGMKPGVRALNSMLEVYSKISNEAKVLEIVDEFARAKLEMNQISYNSIMMLYDRLDRPDVSFVWFNKLCNDPTAQPNDISFSTIISIFLYRKQFQVVEDLLHRMENMKKPPNIACCDEILKNCFQSQAFSLVFSQTFYLLCFIIYRLFVLYFTFIVPSSCHLLNLFNFFLFLFLDKVCVIIILSLFNLLGSNFTSTR